MSSLCALLLTVTFDAAPPQQPKPVPTPSAAADVQQQPAAGSSSPSSSSSSSLDETGGDLPVSLDRIKRSLARPPAIRIDSERPVFRVEVLGRKLTIEDILGPDYLKGPVPSSGMTHQEFLDMVTPKDVQGYAAFSNGQGMTLAAEAVAGWALQKAVHKYQEAKAEREREAARKEVQEALAELEKARAKAGLPPK
jgi:hypothetical protein